MDSAGNMRRTVRASPWRRVTPLPPSRSPPGLTATPPARTTRPAAATPPRSPARRRRGRGGGRQDRASGLRRLGFTMGRHPGRTCVKRKMSIHCRSFSLSRAGPRRINEAPQAQWYVIVIGLLREAAPWSRPPDASPGSLPEVSRYYLPVPRKHALRRHAFLSHGLSESAHTTGGIYQDGKLARVKGAHQAESSHATYASLSASAETHPRRPQAGQTTGVPSRTREMSRSSPHSGQQSCIRASPAPTGRGLRGGLREASPPPPPSPPMAAPATR